MERNLEVRLGRVEDAQAFRELRLEALQRHPEAFGSDYESTEQRPAEHWRERLANQGEEKDNAIYFAEADGRLVGVCGISRDRGVKTEHNAIVYSVYVQPEWRGSGVSDRLVQACLEWARRKGLHYAKLGVVTTNTAAIQCYTRNGFSVYGIDPEVIQVGGVYYDELLMAAKIGDANEEN